MLLKTVRLQTCFKIFKEVQMSRLQIKSGNVLCASLHSAGRSKTRQKNKKVHLKFTVCSHFECKLSYRFERCEKWGTFQGSGVEQVTSCIGSDWRQELVSIGEREKKSSHFERRKWRREYEANQCFLLKETWGRGGGESGVEPAHGARKVRVKTDKNWTREGKGRSGNNVSLIFCFRPRKLDSRGRESFYSPFLLFQPTTC